MSRTELVVTQSLALPPAQVYSLLATAEGMRLWWWPMFEDTTYEMAGEPGTPWHTASASAGLGAHGRVTAADPGRSLDLTWVWDGDPEDDPEPVTCDLTPDPEGTILTVSHHCGPEGLEQLREGWESVLDRLADLCRQEAALQAEDVEEER